MFAKPHPPKSVWRSLPSEQPASSEPGTASLFGGPDFVPDEQKIFAVLRAVEPTHIDELAKRLVAELSSSQIYRVLFEQSLRPDSHAPEEVLRKSHLAFRN